jgi:hypothetical protein
MRLRNLLLSATILAAATGCDSALDVDPVTVVPEEDAIVDAVSARSALAGAYDALQSTSYYGEAMYTFGDLSSDNASHTGTFTSYADADQNVLTSDNGSIEVIWNQIYDAINRANILIQKIPAVAGLSQEEKDQMVAEAYFIRALAYHDLVKYWTGVPIRTVPVADISEAANVTRASVAEVYTQILADLNAAEPLMSNTTGPRNASLGAVRALRARALLYRASPGPTGTNAGDWAAVETAATSVITMSYSLASTYGALFGATGAATSEDIFRLRFTDQDANSIGYYYIVKSLGGRYEVGTTASVRNAYETGDARRAWTIRADPGNANRLYNGKYLTPTGTDHPHVIRLAEVILIRAEARARQSNFLGAVADYNLLRVRAGLAPHVFGVDVIDMTTVLAAIARERRSELAFEGDRWADLIRSGNGVAIMTAHRPTFQAYQILYPIPQSEIDVTRNTDGTPRMTQNTGY